MKTLDIFLGSSMKLMYARKRIGNFIRKQNDRWMSKGVCIRLRIWENFRTEYEGKSKQQEYIEELVLPSQLCLFLYSDRLNPYTEKELDAKLAQNKDSVYVYHIPDKNNEWSTAETVAVQLQNKNVEPIEIMAIAKIDDCITTLVEQFIKERGWECKEAVSVNNWKLYTTIPDDLEHEVDYFGDTIRDLNDTSMEFFNVYCLLHPRCTQRLLEDTDHYIPLMKEYTSDEDLDEFHKAIELQQTSLDNRPAITLFTKGTIHKPNQNPQMAALLEGKDLFTVSVRNYDTIKWRLFCWLLNKSCNFVATIDMVGFQFLDNYVYYYGKPIISLASVDQSGEADTLNNEIITVKDKLNAMVGVTDIQSQRKVAELNAELSFLQQKMNLVMVRVINQWIFEEVKFKANEINTLDKQAFERKTELQKNVLDDAIHQVENVLDNWQETLQSLSDEVYVLEKDLNGNSDKIQNKDK